MKYRTWSNKEAYDFKAIHYSYLWCLKNVWWEESYLYSHQDNRCTTLLHNLSFSKRQRILNANSSEFSYFHRISLWSEDRVENKELMGLFSHEIHIKGTIRQRKQARPVWASIHELPSFSVLVWDDKLWSVVFNCLIVINKNVWEISKQRTNHT